MLLDLRWRLRRVTPHWPISTYNADVFEYLTYHWCMLICRSLKNHFSELCRIHTSVLLVSLSSRIECQRVNLGHLWDWDREDLHQLQSMGTFPWKDENTHHMQGLTTQENYTAYSSANEASLIPSSHAAGYWRRFVPGAGLHATLIDPHLSL